MSNTASTLEVSGLAKTQLAKLRQIAKRAGLSPESLAKELIEDGLDLRERARANSFDELLAPLRSEFRKSGMTEAELDKVVDAARTRHHKRSKKAGS
jgi:hypothetical protein